MRDSEKLLVTMVAESEENPPSKALGLIFADDLPEAYK
jgi:hypothetical protein